MRLFEPGRIGPFATKNRIIMAAMATNMATEAASTGKPVFVLKLDGYSLKFRLFHEELERQGAALTLHAVPRLVRIRNGFGQMEPTYVIGVGPSRQVKPVFGGASFGGIGTSKP